MDSPMAKSKPKRESRERRFFSEEFKQEAVQMLLDGHSASSIEPSPILLTNPPIAMTLA
jgi:hypothetical protein